jgi:Sigma-70 region 2
MADIAHLIEPVIPALRRYARTFVRDTGTADDLVQDALERADMQATAIPMITRHTSAKKHKQRQAMHNHSSLALLLSASSGSSANRLMMKHLIVTCVSRVTLP